MVFNLQTNLKLNGYYDTIWLPNNIPVIQKLYYIILHQP
jgi:hypothetical protein